MHPWRPSPGQQGWGMQMVLLQTGIRAITVSCQAAGQTMPRSLDRGHAVNGRWPIRLRRRCRQGPKQAVTRVVAWGLRPARLASGQQGLKMQRVLLQTGIRAVTVSCQAAGQTMSRILGTDHVVRRQRLIKLGRQCGPDRDPSGLLQGWWQCTLVQASEVGECKGPPADRGHGIQVSSPSG